MNSLLEVSSAFGLSKGACPTGAVEVGGKKTLPIESLLPVWRVAAAGKPRWLRFCSSISVRTYRVRYTGATTHNEQDLPNHPHGDLASPKKNASQIGYPK